MEKRPNSWDLSGGTGPAQIVEPRLPAGCGGQAMEWPICRCWSVRTVWFCTTYVIVNAHIYIIVCRCIWYIHVLVIHVRCTVIWYSYMYYFFHIHSMALWHAYQWHGARQGYELPNSIISPKTSPNLNQSSRPWETQFWDTFSELNEPLGHNPRVTPTSATPCSKLVGFQ